jgi:hypothetical protein
LRKAKIWRLRSGNRQENDNFVDKSSPVCNIDFIRVAARFFSGVPHPHLLGVCCPDIFKHTKHNIPNQILTLSDYFFTFYLPFAGV